jgi:hypothetical protein
MCWYTMYQMSKTPLYIIKVLTNKNAFINIDFCNLKLLWSGYRYAHDAHDAHDLRNWKKKEIPDLVLSTDQFHNTQIY